VIIKGTISSVTSGIRRICEFTGRFTKYGWRPFIQQSGFSSRPNDGDEAIMVRFGDAMVVISSEDTQNPIVLEKGERAMHMNSGNFIHIKKDSFGTIQIKATAKIQIQATSIELGQNALQSIILGEQFQAMFASHVHYFPATSTTPTSTPIGPTPLPTSPPGPLTTIPMSLTAKVAL
jgi:hypothetical protein